MPKPLNIVRFTFERTVTVTERAHVSITVPYGWSDKRVKQEALKTLSALDWLEHDVKTVGDAEVIDFAERSDR